MPDTMTTDVLESLARRKPGTSIAIAADLANDELNSICCIALAWISEGNVHGISYYAKPPTTAFTNRKITADMVAKSPSFADVWDTKISSIINDEALAAFQSENLFIAIKASYEATRKPLPIKDAYIRDLNFLASTYISDLGNDSFVTTMHYMQIAVDLDSTLSRAMACACGIDWLENHYPISNYGIPLSAILSGALHFPAPSDSVEDPADKEAKENEKYARILHYSSSLLIPFFLISMVLTIYYMHRYTETHHGIIDFSKYSATEMPRQEDIPNTSITFDTDKTYIMVRGTYVIMDGNDIQPFLKAAQEQNMYQIRNMVRAGKIIVFASPVRIKVNGSVNEHGFVPVTIQEGDYADKTGYASAKMITT